MQQYHLDGRIMDDREVYRGLRTSIMAGFLGMSWFAIVSGVPITMLMECLSGSGVLIGLIVTIQQLTMFVQIPSALFFERLSSRKKLWGIVAITHRFIWFAPAIIPYFFADTPLVAATILLICIGASSLLGQTSGPMWQNWMADLIPKKISGRFWGIRQSIVTFSFLLATWVSGKILDFFPDPRHTGGSYMGFTIVFAFAALLGISDVSIHMLVPEPKHGTYKKHFNIINRIMDPLKNSDFRWMTISISLWYLAIGVIGSFGIVYLKRDFNFSYTQLSFLVVSASLGPVIFGIMNGFMIDKIGARTFGAIIMFAAPLLAFVWFFLNHSTVAVSLPFLNVFFIPQAFLLLLTANFIGGALGGGMAICQLHMINMLSPKDGRGMAIAMHWSIIGLMSASGPLIGGLIMDYFAQNPINLKIYSGIPFSFFHVLILIYIIIIWLIAAPLMLKVKVKAGEMPLWGVLGSIRVGSPLRAISIVYNIYQTGFDLSFEKIQRHEKHSETHQDKTDSSAP